MIDNLLSSISDVGSSCCPLSAGKNSSIRTGHGISLDHLFLQLGRRLHRDSCACGVVVGRDSIAGIAHVGVLKLSATYNNLKASEKQTNYQFQVF
ncbi:hypothetical protein SLA2020_440950 [Shorea laevis]